jgi:hypothetical protein
MTSVIRRLALGALAATLLCNALLVDSASGAAAPRRLVIVSWPGMLWEDVASGKAPNLARLAQRGSVAAMSVRTIGPKTDLASAYVTIGAGNRARGLGENNTQIRPETVLSPDGGLGVTNLNEVEDDNHVLRYGAMPGSLGEVLHEARLKTGVVGNADGGAVTPSGRGFEERRFAGLALTDRAGVVDFGSVADDLADDDRTGSLNGYLTDSQAFVSAVEETITRADVTLVELTDTYREGQVAFNQLGQAVGGLNERPRIEEVTQRYEAIVRDDRNLGRVIELLDLSSDSLLVLAPSGVGPAKGERLMVAVMAGFGSRNGGWLTSATTKREGIITLPDIAPGILRQFELEVPSQMTGQPYRPMGADEPGERVKGLLAINQAATFHLLWIDEFYLFVIALQILIYVLAWQQLRRRPPERSRIVPALALLFISLPLASLVVRATAAERGGIGVVAPVLIGTSLILTFVALKGPWSQMSVGPPIFVCAVTSFVIALDLLTGGTLEMSSLVGYSPIVAGRFFGIGNLVFAVLGTTAALVTAAIAVRTRYKLLLVAVIGVTVVVLDGAPIFGADFGGIIALVCGFGVLALIVAGRRVSIWRLAGIGFASAVVAFAMGYLDSLRPAEQQTHLGRFTTRLVEGGQSGVSDIIVRKALANWSLLTSSILILIVPIALSFLTFLLLRQRGLLGNVLRTQPGLGEGLTAAAVVNVVGFAVNDSGIAIPAIGLAIVVPYLVATVTLSIGGWAAGDSGLGSGGQTSPQSSDRAHDPLQNALQGQERQQTDDMRSEADRYQNEADEVK